MNSQSKRVNSLVSNYFLEKQPENTHSKEGDVKVDLGAGNPDLPPDRWVKNVLRSSIEKPNAFQYSGYGALPSLKKAIASWYQLKYAISIDSKREVIALSGSKSGINYISLAYLNPGDTVLVPNPGYAVYANAAIIAGAKVKYFDLKPENDWYPDREQLQELIDDSCKMIWINYPNMPTGQRSNAKVFKEMICFAKQHNLLLCHDNPYSHVLNDHPESIFNYSGIEDRVLELNSLSKSHNLAGARIAMLIGNQELLAPVNKIQSNFESGIFRPIQEAAAFALELNGAWDSRLHKIYTGRREIVYRILKELGCYFHRNSVGMFVWAKVPDAFDDDKEFSGWLQQKLGLTVVPGSAFGSNGYGYIRLSLTASEGQLKTVERSFKN